MMRAGASYSSTSETGRTPVARRVLVLWAVAVFAALLTGVAWALASPIGSSPDDDYHMTSIWCPPPIKDSGCRTGVAANGAPTVWVPQQVAVAPHCYAFHAEIPGNCTGTLSGDQLSQTERVDTGAYPGPYYRFMHMFVGKSVMASVVVMRIVNVVIAVTLGLLLALAAPPLRRKAMGWAVLGTCIPLGMFLITSINPSAWTIMGIPAFAVAMDSLCRVETRTLRWANGALAVTAATLAAVSRADGGLYLFVALGAVGLINLHRLRGRYDAFVAAGLAVALGVWSVLSSRQATMADTGLGRPKTQWAQDLAFTNILDLPNLWLGIYGIPGWGMGWLDTAVPATVWIPLIIIAGVLIRAGLAQATWQQRTAAGVILLVCGVMPVYLLSKTGDAIGINYQPRYLLPLFIVMFYVLLRPARDSATPLFTPKTTRTLVIALTIIHAIALLYVLRRYTVGVNGPLFSFSGTPWWWTKSGPGPFWDWLAGTIAFGVLAALMTGFQRWGTVAPDPKNPAPVVEPAKAVPAP